MSKDFDEEYAEEDIEDLGTVKIADEVVLIIAGRAATEVKGVTALSGNISNDEIGRSGTRGLSKGVRIQVTEEEVMVDLSLQIAYGYSVPEITHAVREKVKSAIETMTGLHVSKVNIRIADVNFDNDK